MPDWGNTSSSGSGVSLGNIPCAGGVLPVQDGMILKSAHVYIPTGSGSIRVEIYTGGDANTPSGSTRLVDLGVTAVVAGWNLIQAGDTPLPSGTQCWVVVKSNDGISTRFATSTAGTNYTRQISVGSQGVSADETVASPDPFPTVTGGAVSAPAYYLTYDIVGEALPLAPTGVAATSNVDAPEVTWTLGGGQTSQYVHRVTSGAAAPTDDTTRTSPDLGDVATSWTDDTSPAGGTYDYYVEAANSVGSTFSASPATATVNHAPVLAVTQPIAGTYPSGAEIPCKATASDAEGDTPGAFVEVSTNGGSTYGAAVACPTTITPADGAVRLRYTSAADSGGLTATPVLVDLTVGAAATGGFDAARFIIHALGGIV